MAKLYLKSVEAGLCVGGSTIVLCGGSVLKRASLSC